MRLNVGAIGVFVVLQCVVSFAASPGDDISVYDQSVIVKSQNDTRQYAYHRLENGLKVVLISDAQADKAAASLDVWVGSGEDPWQRQGLAHFLEHMLFLGTEKYPEPDDYQNFIADHGGSHNAYTSSEHTNYFFDIGPAQLESALDRFAQFFIKPLFTEAYVDRERNAVHSEFRARFDNDSRRHQDVLREIVPAKHVLSKFGTGSLDTLSNQNGNLRNDLIKFYHQYYSADQMALVILGPQSLPELAAMALKKFQAVPQRSVSIDDSSPAFDAKTLPVDVFITPKKELRFLDLMFPMPKMDEYQNSALSYLGHLLGYEGQGSLLSLLKAKGWASGLSAGNGIGWRFGSSMMLRITLTEEGVSHTDEMTTLVLHVVEQIKKSGIDKAHFDEMSRLGDIDFRFKEKAQAMHEVMRIAGLMHETEPADLLSRGYLFKQFKPQLIRRHLAYIRKDNMLRLLVAPEQKTDKKTRLYDVPYRTKPLLLEDLSVSRADTKQLRFPEPNKFIPTQFSLVKTDAASQAEVPQLLKNTEQLSLWHQADTSFAVPRAQIFLRILSPYSATNAENMAYTTLMVALLRESLNEETYQAALAGQGFSISSFVRGFDIRVGGYSDGVDELLDIILVKLKKLKKLKSMGITPAIFDSTKRRLIRQYKNQAKNAPYRLLIDKSMNHIENPMVDHAQRAKTLETIDQQQLEKFAVKALKNLQGQILFYGNYDKKTALKLGQRAAKRLKLKNKKNDIAKVEIVNLAGEAHNYTYNYTSSHKDAALLMYWQALDESIESRAMMAVLTQALHSPMFHSLRTEKQLGYIVMARPRRVKEVPGAVVLIQSPVASAGRLYQEVDSFLAGFNAKLKSDFEASKQAVLIQLAEQPKNLSAAANRRWGSILSKDVNFDRKQHLIAAVKKISPAMAAEYFNNVFLQKNGRLILHVGDLGDVKINAEKKIDDIQAFKKQAKKYIYD